MCVFRPTHTFLGKAQMLTKEQQTNMAKWVEVLQSGKYNQVQGRLKLVTGDKAEYCCLGIAAECVLGFDMVPSYIGGTEYGYETGEYEGHIETAGLRPDERKKFGLDISFKDKESKYITKLTGYYPGTPAHRQDALVGLNDNGFSFREIAMIIVALGWDVK